MDRNYSIDLIAACSDRLGKVSFVEAKKAWMRLRKNNNLPGNISLTRDISEKQSLGDAYSFVKEKPHSRILMNFGFKADTLVTSDEAGIQLVNMITSKGKETLFGTASLLQSTIDFPKHSLSMCATSSESALRKVIKRHWHRNRVFVRTIEARDLDDYFSLRYRVWREQNYIPEHKRSLTDLRSLEIDFTDLFSDPIGVFQINTAVGSRPELIGCGRLVYGPQAEKFTPHGQQVKDFIERRYPELVHLIKKPTGPILSYDVLESFPGFIEYYRDNISRGARQAELSRIIVDSKYCRKGLGEIIVDSLIDLAHTRKINYLFLGCIKKHEEFYARSGFIRIEKIASQEFINVRVPAIAMHQTLPERRIRPRIQNATRLVRTEK